MEKKKLFKIFVVFLITFFLIVIAGCGTIDTIKEKFKGNEETEISVETETDNEIFEENNITEFQETDLNESVVLPEQETYVVELWFADENGERLVKELREISKVEAIARMTVGELLNGPSPESELLPTIPVGTELLDINVKEDGLIIVDFSSELINNHIGDPQGEALTVFSIVNTLCQFPTVDRVQFLVEGKYVDTIAGSINVSTSLEPNTNI